MSQAPEKPARRHGPRPRGNTYRFTFYLSEAENRQLEEACAHDNLSRVAALRLGLACLRREQQRAKRSGRAGADKLDTA